MAIIVPGMKCPLCDRPIAETDNIIAFPAFVSNHADPLWEFSDGVFHEECFAHHPLRESAAAAWGKVKAASVPDSRVCVVCAKSISSPEDYLFFGLLASDPSHPLHDFNLLHFHLSHISEWNDLERFLASATRPDVQRTWRGPSLEWLLRPINSHAT